MIQGLPRLVARLPARVHAKLLVAFLVIAGLLVIVSAVGLRVLGETNRRAEELIILHRKIAAYRQLQHDTTGQLYSVTSTLALPLEQIDTRMIEAALRQLQQFGYDLDRLQYVAKDEATLLHRIQEEYNRFIQVMSEAITMIAGGRITAARELQRTQATPLADRLERLTNELVNKAEAEMVERVERSHNAYTTSQWVVIGVAVGSVGLALVLGYALSWSLTGPVTRMDAQFQQIARGDFSQRVAVPNRDEFGTLATNLNRMTAELGQLYQQLEAASRHKSEFLANMSHELRTPLNAVIGFSEVLLEKMFGDVNDKQEEYLQDILGSGTYLLSLINDILDLSKVEAGRLELELGTFDLRQLLEGSLVMVKERALAHGIALSLAIADDVPSMTGDERKMKQILFNLLSNAVKFTPDRGKVGLTATMVDAMVQIAVWDTGVGIAPEDQQRIFEEFQQVGKGLSGKTEGTGLGLTLARKFVELHGGSLWVESTPGQGSTFTFTLPVRGVERQEALLMPQEVPPSEPAPQGVQTSPGPLVLVVEDDARGADLLRIYLSEAGYRVEMARDGAEGLEKMRQLVPAAVVLDILLPRLDGWAFLTQAKADPSTRDVPVVIVSIIDQKGKGFALGAADYLIKPVQRAELLRALRNFQLTAPEPAAPRTILAIDDDPKAVELLAAVLEPEGFHVLKAYGGEAGIALARTAHPDLIILDLLMPEVNGFEVLERLGQSVATRQMPVILFTLKQLTADEQQRVQGRIACLAQKEALNQREFVDLVKDALQRTLGRRH